MRNCKAVYRHLTQKLFSCTSVYLEVIVASILFALAMYVKDPISVVINLLYFIIILEVTRMVIEYIRSPEHRVKIRYLVDASIVAVLREIIIIVVDSHNMYEHLFQLALYIPLLFITLSARYIVMKITPDGMELPFRKGV